MASGVQLNQRGQKLGPKGLKTRRRILEIMRELLDMRSFREITAADITSALDVNPATFCIYFDDTAAVVEALLGDIAEQLPDLGRHFDPPWSDGRALQYARAFIDAYLDYVLEHYPVMRVRNQLADEGDTRFAELRARETADVMKGLTRQIATGGQPGRKVRDAALRDAAASAGLLVGMVGRLCTVCTLLGHHPYNVRGLTRGRLAAASARLLVAAVDGSGPPGSDLEATNGAKSRSD